MGDSGKKWEIIQIVFSLEEKILSTKIINSKELGKIVSSAVRLLQPHFSPILDK